MARTRILGNAVLAAASTIFRKAGYRSTSMDEIAEEAGVSKATLYRYYPAKDALFAAVLSELPVAQFKPPVELGPNPGVVLGALGKRILSALCDPAYQDLFRVTLAERSRFPELTAALWDRIIGRGVRLVTAMFAEEVSRGRIRKLDPRLAAQEFIGMLLAFALMQVFSTRSSKTDQRTAVRQAVNVFLLGAMKEGNRQQDRDHGKKGRATR